VLNLNELITLLLSPHSHDTDNILGIKREKRGDKDFTEKVTDKKDENMDPVYSDELDHNQDHLSPEEKQLAEMLTPIRYTITFDDVHTLNHSIWSANLNLYKRKIISDFESKRTANPTEVVEVYRLSTIDSASGSIEYPVLIASMSFGTEDNGYVAFDITEGLRRWQVEGNLSRLTLEVVIRVPESASTGKLLLPSLQFDVPTGKEGFGPNLIVKALVGSKRSKRQITEDPEITINSEYCLNNPEENNCCLRETTIDFRADLGIDWVIAPRTFQFTYCGGLCPRSWPSNTLNAEYRSLVRLNNPTSSPAPCCVASKTEPLKVLTYENSTLVLKSIDGMLTEECQCR